MKKPLHFILILFILLTFIFVISSCNHDLKKDNDDDNQTIENNDDDNNQTTENNNDDNPTVDSIGVNADSFFWGTWVRMDNGKEYEFLESSVEQAAKKYKVEASNDNSISVSELGTFTKESDSVIVCDNIPYFRKGGTNLEYLLKIVGFESSIRQAGRAAGSVVGGIRGKGKSKKYTTFESDGESDIDGFIKLTAPTVNDVQTVTISNGNDVVVIPGLAISNSGDYMGTVALVSKEDYNLKITGTVSDSQKDGGYLYGNNAKTYDMVLTITNISENKCKSSVCTISTDDTNLNLSSETNLQGFTISTLANGATKTINLKVSYGNLTEPYVNTGINIKITNASTGQEWIDYIPLRFFKGTIPITISAKNPENNKNAALNGFVIYPDGNNQFFAIPHNSSKPVFVPTFGKDNSYKLVFSGATVTSKLDDSTEMYYTVEPASLNPRKVVTEGDAQELIEYMNFGGDNHSETTSYSVTQGFESYLSEGEIDYYTISADSDYYYSTDAIPLFSVSYENEKGSAPETILVKAGSFLTAEQLPELECEGFEFLGWYDGDKKVVAGDKVNGNVVLKAKWKQIAFLVSFETNGGSDIASYSTSVIEFIPESTRENYVFDGWYTNPDFSGECISFPFVIEKKISLYAKWLKLCTISFVNEYGLTPDSIFVCEGTKLDSVELPELVDDDYLFDGWYNRTLEEIDYINDNIILVAKWIKKCFVSFVSEYGSAPTTFFVGCGKELQLNQLPHIKYKGWRFIDWFSSNNFEENSKVSSGYIVNSNLTLYAKWETYDGPEFTENIEVLPKGTDGTAGTDVTYILFGDWPQTIKSDDVEIYENITETQGAFTYYKGSDDCWYVKCRENASDTNYTYSNGLNVASFEQNSFKYFKLEPIKWRILTSDYNSTGKVLLLAENVLNANVNYYHYLDTRTISNKTIYPNNYMESEIRAYLNGIENSSYHNKGFLQTAFTEFSQQLINITEIDNSAASTSDSDGKVKPASQYICETTYDKIFLLSEKEVTELKFGFELSGVYGINNTRIREATDFCKANYVGQDLQAGNGGWWWLRSPLQSYYGAAAGIRADGCDNVYFYVSNNSVGIVPALTILVN